MVEYVAWNNLSDEVEKRIRSEYRRQGKINSRNKREE